MEFLITYGWAILIILTAFACLIYISDLNTDDYLPDSCNIHTPGLFCADHSVTFEPYPNSFSPIKNVFRFYIKNSGGQSYILKNIQVLENSDFDLLPWKSLGDYSLVNGGSYLIELDLEKDPPIPPGNQKVKVEFVLETRNSDTGLTHYHKGRVRARID